MTHIERRLRSKRNERGLTIVELMIACVVLAIGLIGVAVMFASATSSASRNKVDTNSTLVAKMVLEQISAQDPTSTSNMTLTDCSGTAWTVATAGGPLSTWGAGAPLDINSSHLTYGGIDFTKDPVTNYSMKYKDCQAGQTTTYDVRWNIITINAGTTRMITVAAHKLNVSANDLGNAFFAVPVSLRGIGGPQQ